MEDKTFELLEKMYGEFTKRFDNVESEIKELKNDLKETKTMIEHDIMPKLQYYLMGIYKSHGNLRE